MKGRLFCTQCGVNLDDEPVCPSCEARSEYWEVDPPLLPDAMATGQSERTPSATVMDWAAASASASLSGIVKELFSESFLLGGTGDSDAVSAADGSMENEEDSSILLDPAGAERAVSTTVNLSGDSVEESDAGPDSLNPDGASDRIGERPPGEDAPPEPQ